MTVAARSAADARRLLTPAPRRRRFDTLHIALAAPLLTYVWRVQDLIPGLAVLKIPTLATLAAAAVLFVDPRIAQRFRLVRRHPLSRLLPWYVLAAAISVAGSLLPGWSLDYFARSFLPAVALAIIVPIGIFAVRDAVTFAAIQVAGATMYCIAVLARFEVDESGRLATLIFYDANDIGMLLVCTLPLCAYFIRHAKSGLTRILALGITFLFLVTIAQTGSRGAFIGLMCVGLYLLIHFRTVRLVTRVGLVAATTLVLLFGAGERYRELMSTILHPTTDYNWVGRGDTGRMNIWKRGIGYVAEHPFTGVGIWAFPVAEGTISPLAARQEYSKGLKWSAAHNSFIQVLAELGVAGFILFVAILFVAWRSAARLARDATRLGFDPALGELANAHAAALVGYAVAGFFLSQGYAPYLYFVIGMIVGLDVTMRHALPRATSRKVVPSSGAWGWRSGPPRPGRTVRPAPSAAPPSPASP